jgi:hypothetical protein
MLRLVRRIARCGSLTDAGGGPYSKVSLEMLPTQLPIVPVNLLAPSELHRPTQSAYAMRSGAGPLQQGRIRRVRENGTYRDTRSVSRPSSGGSVPPSSFEETYLRQPIRIASTLWRRWPHKIRPVRSPIATPAPEPSVVGAMGCGE